MDGAPNLTVREGHLPVTADMGLYYRVFGARSDAVPMVCLHGYWRTSRDFEELAQHVGPRRQVVAPDLRGRGRSGRSDDDRDYDFDHLSRDIEALLDAEGIPRAAFVGLALGAQLAMDLAARRPDLVAGIVFNDSAPESNAAAGQKMKAFSGDDEISFEEALARVKGQYATAFPRFNSADFERLLRRNYRRTDRGGYVRDFDQKTNEALVRTKDARPTFWDEYRGLGTTPVLILRGANSEYLTEDVVGRMLAELPTARLVTIPDCGHPVMLWEPEAFAAIDAFLGEVDARRGRG